jgi:hypothetical protein
LFSRKESKSWPIVTQTKKALVNMLRAADVFQMSQTGSGDLGLRRAGIAACWPHSSSLSSLKERARGFFQLFFDVTAKKAAASWRTRLPPHFGHLMFPFSYSARVRIISNGFLQSSQ